jgi:hypothetical protein
VREPGKFYIDFAVDNPARFAALRTVFYELKKDTAANAFRGDNDWLAYFDDAALSHFWCPSDQELHEYWERYDATPINERGALSEEHGWGFFSMIEAFQNGEYTLVSCELRTPTTARLEYDPFAGPFGGTDSFHALIEAFGCSVTFDVWQDD